MSIRRWLIYGSVAVVGVIAVAAGAWFLFVREENDPATSSREIDEDIFESVETPESTATAEPEATASPASSSSGAVETFTIVTDQSTASYYADEKLASLPTNSTAQGITTIEGAFHLSAEGLDPSQESVFVVDLTGLESGEGRRDERVQGALETGTFPTATFTAESLEGYPGEFPSDGTEITMQLTGTLDLHGVQREVTWEVQARREGDIISAIATVNFLYEDFGIPVPNIGGFVSVEEDVTLQIDMIATKS